MSNMDAAHLGEFTCPNCGATAQGVACQTCGQKRVFADDLSLKHVVHEVFEEFTHLDGRLFTSLKLLFLRPGQLTLDFLEGRRKRHIHPFRLFLVIAAIAFFSLRHAGFTLKTLTTGNDSQLRIFLIEPAAKKAGLNWETFVQQREKTFQSVFQSAEMAAEVLVIGLVLWLLFHARFPYLGQHMVFVLHYSSFCLVLNILGHFIQKGPLWFLAVLLILITVGKYLYMVLAVRCVYKEKLAVSVAKSLAAYVGLFLAGSIAFLIALFSAILV